MEIFTLINAAIFCFIVALLFFEASEQLELLFLTVFVIVVANYFWLEIPYPEEYFNWKVLLMYLFMGFLHSLIRTWDLSRKLTVEQKKYVNLKSKVFRWIFFWPVSTIVWICRDWFSSIWDFIYKHLSFLYTKILNL